jgi:cytidyltransferase-like protein
MNRKISVITGCYQILHSGHIYLFSIAASLGDITLLLNSDLGVKKLKNYFVAPWEYRKNKIMETGLVKNVLKFDTNPTELIKMIRPNYLLVGPDHSFKEVMSKGGEFAEKIIRVYPLGEILSSSRIYRERNEGK